MYIENTKIKVIGTKYERGGKEKKNATLSEFNFDDGIQSKDLSKFLQSLQEDQGHRFCGETTCNITIDTSKEY